jgi:hypothetical protein
MLHELLLPLPSLAHYFANLCLHFKKREEVQQNHRYIYLAAHFWSNCVATQLVQMLRHPLLLQNFIVAFTKVGVFEARNLSLSEIVLDAVDSFSAMMVSSELWFFQANRT